MSANDFNWVVVATDNQNEKGKKIMKKTEVTTGESTDRANEGIFY